MNSIFVESTASQGLLYNRYHKIPDIVNDFLDDIDKAIKEITKDDTKELDLNEKLNNFKSNVNINMDNPDPVNISNIKSQRNKCKECKDEVLNILNRLGSIKKNTKYGNNYLNGILSKPKVYNKDNKENVNSSIRQINRCLDWCEKVILDLLNLTDQDMNLLCVIQKVYYKVLFENFNNGDLLSECIDDHYESFLSYNDNDSDEDESEIDTGDLLNLKMKDEEFYPVFALGISFDKEILEDMDDDSKRMIKMGNLLHNVTRGDTYTHALLSFDPTLSKIYHFTSEGVLIDNINEYPVFNNTSSIYVSVTYVTKDERDTIERELNEMVQSSDSKYDILSMVTMFFGKAYHKNKRMVCSSLVGYLLSCGNFKNVHKDFSMMRPEDITLLPRAFYVMEFKNAEEFRNRCDEFQARIKSIYNNNIDEIREYNNILPKVVLKGKMKEKNTVDKFFDWLVTTFS